MATETEILDAMIGESRQRVELIQEELDLERRYLEKLTERRLKVAGGAPARPRLNGDRTVDQNRGRGVTADAGNEKSLPDAIADILRATGEPMRAVEVATKLAALGHATTAKSGLLPSVLSALGRRDDLFEKVGRGIYRFKPTEGGGHE